MSGNNPAGDSACGMQSADGNAGCERPCRDQDRAHLETPGHRTDWYSLAATLAAETVSIISREIAVLNKDAKDSPQGEARLKALLGLTKAIQSLEDMINRMEHAIDGADRYPRDIAEFRKQLEEQIAALVDEGDQACIY